MRRHSGLVVNALASEYISESLNEAKVPHGHHNLSTGFNHVHCIMRQLEVQYISK